MSPMAAKTRPPLTTVKDVYATLQMLIDNARQPEEGDGVVVDGDGQVVTELIK